MTMGPGSARGDRSGFLASQEKRLLCLLSALCRQVIRLRETRTCAWMWIRLRRGLCRFFVLTVDTFCITLPLLSPEYLRRGVPLWHF